MATKMKKLYKKFKFISRIFGVASKEKKKMMEIGFPTDVKHVTHIGLDTPSDTLSNWENEFKMSATDFTESSNHSNFTLSISTCSSQDFEQSMEYDSSSDHPNINPKKQKHKRFTSKSSTTSKTNKVHGLNSSE